MMVYSAIPSSPELAPDDDEKALFLKETPPWEKYLFIFACICSIFSTVFALVVYLSPLHNSNISSDSLKRPSPYPNLGSVFRNGSHQPLGPIYSLSQLLLQLDTHDPARKLHEDWSRQHDSKYGVMFPDDRHFVVSKDTSTIVQFKTLDFGMERCVLNAVLPNKTAELDPAIRMSASSVINVWKLDLDTEISPHNPSSWDRAPRRRSHFAQFEFPASGTWSSKEFHCPSLSFGIYEFACASGPGDCHVEFWQDRASPNGIYVKQFDSLNDPDGQ